MRAVKHICDLCGNAIPVKEPRAMLRVPNFDKAEATATVTHINGVPVFEMSLQMLMTGSGPAHDSTDYDVCRGCCEGLLRARAGFVRALREKQYSER